VPSQRVEELFESFDGIPLLSGVFQKDPPSVGKAHRQSAAAVGNVPGNVPPILPEPGILEESVRGEPRISSRGWTITVPSALAD
jgi:hypothetical protein